MTVEPSVQRPPRRHPHARRAFLVAGASLASLTLVASAFAMGTYFWARSKILTFPIETQSPGASRPSDIVNDPCTVHVCNYLLLGSDSRKGLSKVRYGTTDNGYRSDTIILVHTDPGQKHAVILSFPRDLWVHIPDHGYDRINAAFEAGVEHGGPQLVARTIRDLTGLQVNHVLYVDLRGFQGVVNALGGIPMCVDRPLYDVLARLNIPKPGCYNFDGRTALSYVRARHLPGDCIPDFARIGRQQQFLRAVMAKILSPGELLHLPSIVTAVTRNIRVDPGLRDPTELLHLLDQLRGVTTGDADFRVVPTVPAGVTQGGVFKSVVKAIEPEASTLFRDLRDGKPLGTLGKELPSTPPSPANIKVAVYDANSAGAAEQVLSVLQRSGFDTTQGIQAASALHLKVKGAVLLYRPGQSEIANIAHGFIPNLPQQQAPKGVLKGVDLALVITPGFTPQPPGANGAGSAPSC
jgi:LCP family protein required for cell wall assembly